MRRLIASRISTAPLSRRSGLTLIELLAVISVLAILLSVAIPVIRPALKDRKLRESARLLNAYVAGVQARATELGRPVGIVLVRGNSGNNRDKYQCTEIFTAEVPQPYAGDLVVSKALVEYDYDNSAKKYVWKVKFKPSDPFLTIPYNPLFNTLIKPPIRNDAGEIVTGELFLLRLDYKDPLYQCMRTGDQEATIQPASLDLSGPPRQYVNAPKLDTVKRASKRAVPFQIYRSPTRSTAAPLQLSSSVAIDLSVSGMGSQGIQFNPKHATSFGRGNITIMFNPNGSVKSVYVGGFKVPMTEKIYLMIGRVNQIETKWDVGLFLEDPNTDYRPNAMDPVNYWFTINPRTGQIRNSINRPDMVTKTGNLRNKIGQARTDARDGIGVGGR